MNRFFKTLWQDQSGQDLAEYAMLVVLIAIVAVVAVVAFGNNVLAAFNEASTSLFPFAGGG